MATYTTIAAEDGAIDGAGLWDNATDPIVMSSTLLGGLRFTTLPFTSITSTGIGGAAPINASQANTLFTSVTLTLRVTAVGATTLTVSLVPEANPAAYSNTLLPGARSEVVVSLDASGALGAHAIPAGTSTQIITLDLGTVEARAHRLEGFSGNLALTLTPAAVISINSAETGTSVPTLTTGELPIDTGMSGPVLRTSRADRCDQTGFRTLREDLVRDGYREGLWVRPEAWDPPEPPDSPEPIILPPVNEG